MGGDFCDNASAISLIFGILFKLRFVHLNKSTHSALHDGCGRAWKPVSSSGRRGFPDSIDLFKVDTAGNTGLGKDASRGKEQGATASFEQLSLSPLL